MIDQEPFIGKTGGATRLFFGAVAIVGGVFLFAAGGEWFKETTEGTCVERGARCPELTWRTLLIVGLVTLSVGVSGWLITWRADRAHEDEVAG